MMSDLLIDEEMMSFYTEQDYGAYYDDMDVEIDPKSETEEALRKKLFEVDGADDDSWENDPVWVACRDGYLTVGEAEELVTLRNLINRRIDEIISKRRTEAWLKENAEYIAEMNEKGYPM